MGFNRGQTTQNGRDRTLVVCPLFDLYLICENGVCPRLEEDL
jgi:hypothetical protein